MSYAQNAAAPVTLTPDEADRLLQVTGEHVDGFRDHVIFAVALSTALREHEIAALNVGDVARPVKASERQAKIRTRVQLRVFKRSRHGEMPADRQQVFLPRAVRQKLEKLIAWKRRKREDVRPGAPLFVSRFGRRISTRQLRNLSVAWQRRAGFDRLHPFHRLRHTALSRLYASTRNLLLVQKAARHATARSTEIYTHVTDEDLHQALEDLHR